MAQQRPAAGRVPRARGAASAFATAALGVEQRAQVLEAVGGNQAGRHQFPQRIFDFAGQAAGGAGQVGEEATRRALSRAAQHFAGGMRERLARAKAAVPPAASGRRRAGRSRAARRAWAARGRCPFSSGRARTQGAERGGPSSLRPRDRAGRDTRAGSARRGGAEPRTPTRRPGIRSPASWRMICSVPSTPCNWLPGARCCQRSRKA